MIPSSTVESLPDSRVMATHRAISRDYERKALELAGSHGLGATFYEEEARRSAILVGLSRFLPTGRFGVAKVLSVARIVAELVFVMYFNVRIDYLRYRGYLRENGVYWICWSALAIGIPTGIALSRSTQAFLLDNIAILFPLAWIYYYVGNGFMLAKGRELLLVRLGGANAIKAYEAIVVSMWMGVQICQQLLTVGTAGHRVFSSLPPILTTVVGVLLIICGYFFKGWATWCIGIDNYFWRDQLLGVRNERLVEGPIFRLVKHPTYTLGYLQSFGFAIANRSLAGLVGGLALQCGILLFVYLVEEPGMRRLYEPPATNTKS